MSRTNTKQKPKSGRTPPPSQRVLAQVPSLIPIVDYTEEETFLDGKGGVIDILQIRCMDLNAAKEYDVMLDVYSWSWLYKSYAGDMKVVTMNYPVDTYTQISYMDHLIGRTENPVFRMHLENEREYLVSAHEKYDAREFYLMLFSDNAQQHRKNLNRVESHLGRSGQVEKIRFTKKVQILRKLNNMNTQLGKTDEFIDIPRGIPSESFS